MPILKTRAAAAAAGLLCLVTLVPAAAAGQSIQINTADTSPTIQVPKAGVSLDVNAIDKSANPCQDFYAYACGNWRKNNPIPADKTRWGRFDELGEHNRYTLYALLEQAANSPKTPLQVKYGNYYAACMNQPLADKLGAKPIEPALARIAAWNDKSALAGLLAQMQQSYGLELLYRFGSEQDQKDSTQQIGAVFQGGLSLPDRDYYLQDNARMKDIREKYVAHVTKMFVLLGDSPEQAAAEAKAVMTVETALAKGSTPRVDLRNPANVYHVMTLAQLEQLTPDYKWATYFSGIGHPLPTLNVATPNFFKTMNEQVSATSVADLKSYLRWHVVHRAAGSLSTAFDDENFDFYGRTLNGQPEQRARWKRCSDAVDAALGEALGKLYVARYFAGDSKTQMLQMVADIEAAMGKDIDSLDWMSPATRARAHEKLATVANKIGYPDRWRDYSALEVKPDDALGNALRATAFENDRELAKIGKPVDRLEWGMTPPTVNAYYDDSMNDINFPAGILQPPFYGLSQDLAVNYGHIGGVIGHELTHGFDDEGRKFDAHGNLSDWWTPADIRNFTARTDCLVNEYGSFTAIDDVKVNGKLTLGENTADNGGLVLAYMAYLQRAKDNHLDLAAKQDNLTGPQRFYIAFAQNYCQDTRPEAVRSQVLQDPHAPDQFRVNGVLVNQPGFAAAFSCKKGSPMVPTNSCRVW